MNLYFQSLKADYSHFYQQGEKNRHSVRHRMIDSGLDITIERSFIIVDAHSYVESNSFNR